MVETAQRTSLSPEERKEALIYLQPIAAPSVLGLYGFAGATMMVGSNLAGWWGPSNAPMYLFPFAATFGGIAQFTAGMWAFKARDALATAMHGMWGAFWIAYGVLYFLFAMGTLTPPTGAFPSLAFWFLTLAWITAAGAFAAAAINGGIFMVLLILAAGSAMAAASYFGGYKSWEQAAGWLFVASAAFAWYTASAMMIESAWGREILPLMKTKHVREAPKVNEGVGEPGVFHGQ